jgi:hypothetical protein
VALVGVVVPCLGMLPLVTACGAGGRDEPSGGPRAASGISRKEYCAMGRPVITRITAEQEQATVVVRWREVFESLDERVFRVYRRSGPDAPWARVAEVTLPPGNGGSWRDPAPLTVGTAQYGMTQVTTTCGEGRLCTSTAPGAQCSLATVARREQ